MASKVVATAILRILCKMIEDNKMQPTKLILKLK